MLAISSTPLCRMSTPSTWSLSHDPPPAVSDLRTIRSRSPTWILLQSEAGEPIITSETDTTELLRGRQSIAIARSI